MENTINHPVISILHEFNFDLQANEVELQDITNNIPPNVPYFEYGKWMIWYDKREKKISYREAQ